MSRKEIKDVLRRWRNGDIVSLELATDEIEALFAEPLSEAEATAELVQWTEGAPV